MAKKKKAKKLTRSECETMLIEAEYPLTGKDRIIYVKDEDDFLRVSILHPWKRHYDDDLRAELRAFFNTLRYGIETEMVDEDGNVVLEADTGRPVMIYTQEPRDFGVTVQVDYKTGPGEYRTEIPENAVAHKVCGVSVNEWAEADEAQRQKWLIA